jgi:hypothetical protein
MLLRAGLGPAVHRLRSSETHNARTATCALSMPASKGLTLAPPVSRSIASQGRGFGRLFLRFGGVSCGSSKDGQCEYGQDRHFTKPLYFSSPTMIAVADEGALGPEDGSA